MGAQLRHQCDCGLCGIRRNGSAVCRNGMVGADIPGRFRELDDAGFWATSAVVGICLCVRAVLVAGGSLDGSAPLVPQSLTVGRGHAPDARNRRTSSVGRVGPTYAWIGGIVGR